MLMRDSKTTESLFSSTPLQIQRQQVIEPVVAYHITRLKQQLP
jgi:hypothetical protein